MATDTDGGLDQGPLSEGIAQVVIMRMIKTKKQERDHPANMSMQTRIVAAAAVVAAIDIIATRTAMNTTLEIARGTGETMTIVRSRGPHAL